MKILTLKFKNINSLAGEWEIDFSRPEFTENGLFAITGKTGSGKSSILDAISLALYGRTPRVNVTGADNDVMTRGTNDCFAEISFESAGKIHKASWKQERTRTGNLKPVQRSVADSENVIIADQINACNNKIEEILGLSFEQFTKVILLAQGGFAAFLQADKSDKGELLEQITGTEIYGEISRTVYERNKLEIQKLEFIDKELGAIKILADEDIRNLKGEITELGSRKEQINKDLEIIAESQNRLRELNDLKKQIGEAKAKLPELLKTAETAKTGFEKAENELETLKCEQEKIAPVFVKVRELDTKIAEKNSALNSMLESLKNIEGERKKLSDEIQIQNKDLHDILTDLKQKEERKISSAKYESLVGNYSAIENQYSQVKIRLNDWHSKQNDFEKADKDLTDKISACEKAEKIFNEKHRLLEEKLQDLEDRKKKSAEILDGKESAALLSAQAKISDLGRNISNLIESLKSIISHKREIENCEKAISENNAKEEQSSAEITHNKNILNELKNQIDLLRENITLAKTIQSLEEHRKNLEDGKECPLCGATVHPFASGNLPVADEKEKRLHALSKQFDDVEKAVKTSEKILAKATSDKENAEHNKKALEKKLSDSREKNVHILSEIQEFNVEISEDVACLEKLEKIRTEKREEWQRIETIVKDAARIEAEIIELRDNAVPRYQQEEKAAEKLKTESETAKKLAEKAVETSEDQANQAKIQYEADNAALLSKLAEYGVEDIVKLKNCRDLWIDNENSILKLTRQKIELEGSVKTTESQIEAIQKRFAVENAEKEGREAVINELLTARKALFGDKKVANEEQDLKKRIGEAETAKNSNEKAKNEAHTELEKTKAIILESENRLSAKQAENISEKTSEELQAEYDDKQGQSDEISQKIGANKQALDANQENLEKNKKKLAEKEAQLQISNRWRRLDTLIGSFDGKKYRNFAQALTFENLIVHANKQLRKMSERYILKRADDAGNPFELSVIDKFRNCDERTAKNLSGGEKFIVSLSLALGLANMASRNMKIDTMFIDEGFGTLDSDYLNVALTALSNLQSEGKLIGVISHLTELKERIATHIEVIPVGDGRSKIEI